jgi:glucose-6-phosphate-specific signal transduction histidine kinase
MIFGIDSDLFLGLAFLAMLVMLGLMLGVGIPRGKRLQDTNKRIAENQQRQIALQEQQIALQERYAAAMERVAAALEAR